MTGTISSRRAAIWLAGLSLACFVYFLPRWSSYNEDARIDMVLSIVDRGVVNIDPYHLNTGDEDKFKGHFYSNKAPGQSLVGVPVYAAFKLATSLGPIRSLVDDMERSSAWHGALNDAACLQPVPGDYCRFVTRPKLDFAMLQYLEAVLTVAIPSTLMLLLFFWFLGFFSESLFNRTILTGALGLGTMVFPYSQLFFSHVPAAALDLAGFVLVFCVIRGLGGDARVPSWIRTNPALAITLAGLSLGLSIVFEYPATIVVVLVGLYALLQMPRRLVALLIAGAIPPVLVVMAYNFSAFHNPFTTGYGCNEVKFKGECQGIAGFTWPPSAAKPARPSASAMAAR